MSMIDEAGLAALAVHKIGNKSREEGFMASEELASLQDPELKEVLKQYFLSSFKQEEYFRFSHPSQLSLNEMYHYISEAFADLAGFHEQSVNMLTHLYEQSEHPKIKSGELYVAYFTDCLLEDELVDAIGIFKSENKDTFLTISEDLALAHRVGVPAKAVDKGCLIYNAEAEDGFRIKLIDANSTESQFWKDNFLQVTDLLDHNFTTKAVMNMCREFSEELYGEQKDKPEQRKFLNKSMEYFAKNETFDIAEFTTSVIEEPEAAEKFKTFNKTFAEERGIEDIEGFKISKPAVKTMKRKFKNLIKLDTQIEIKLGGKDPERQEQYVERGYDENKGMHFYKVFFHTED
ncbi:MAG: nucleoid-associated protein [Hymenobacteraceae bacterium]|nr:nucleoid-associated protein [Hymenobacteraceae bacterium]